VKRFMLCALCFFSLPSFALAAEQDYDKLLPLAKKYIGVPYQFGGSSEKGFDCSGFTRHVFEQMDVKLARTTAEQYKQGKEVKKSELRVGDLVFFETYKKGASHAGIYIGDNQFIHADSSKGISIAKLNDPYYWGPRYIGARRVLAYEKNLGEFQDVDARFWAKKEIEALATKERMLGYEESYFKPDETMTRAQAAGVLAEFFELAMNDRKETFKDVPNDHWAVGAINALVEEHIVNANEKAFRPDEPLTRAQLALWFANAWDLKEAQTAIPFADVAPGDEAYDAIQRLVSAGIATGDENGNFRPQEAVTRAQFAVFFYRAMNAK
jgi:lipoprotein Spr